MREYRMTFIGVMDSSFSSSSFTVGIKKGQGTGP